MTTVKFKFLFPDGTPISNETFMVALSRAAFHQTLEGMVYPEVIEGTTDADGLATLQLFPANKPYYVQMTLQGNGLSLNNCTAQLRFRIAVPDTATPIWADDLIVTDPIFSQAWDAEAIEAIILAKAEALAAAVEANASAQAASVSEVNAKASENAAKASQTAARTSEVNAKASEVAALASKQAAATAETNAAASALAAANSASAAAASETNAATSKTGAAVSAADALASKQAAKTSETNSKASELAAKTSETNAKTSETNAKNSEQTAVASATDAQASKVAAAASKDAAAASETLAAQSAASALASKQAASTSETNAAASATTATQKAAAAASSEQTATMAANTASAAAATSVGARDRAEQARDEAVAAAATVTGSLADGGAVDLSSGAYPPKPTKSTFWKVTVGGTVNGIQYGIGDTLVFTFTLDEFYKIDNTESVSSVAGKTGVVTLNKTDVGLPLVDNTADANKPVSGPQAAALVAKADIRDNLSSTNVDKPLSANQGRVLAGMIQAASADAYTKSETNALLALKANTSALGTSAYATLATSVFDGTVGRVLRIGDHGLGGTVSSILSTNIDSLNTTGSYYVSSAADQGSLPVKRNGYLDSLVFQVDQYAKQVFTTYNGDSWERVRQSGAWSSWFRTWSAYNALGTVSQVGGLPTGAIIERGSNVNGEYTKYADGTMECWLQTTVSDQACDTASGSLFFGTRTWTYPIAFVGSPAVQMSSRIGTGISWGGLGGAPSNTAATARFIDNVSRAAGTSTVLSFVAKGRWF